MSAEAPRRIRASFPKRRLDRRAVDIVRRLQDAGHEAYLVGGCVRDLLLGHRPKDHDVATSARPGQVRRLFRRARIIGRRFRIVHVHQGREIYEVATFRRAPREEEEEGGDVAVIREDNVYGSAGEDAHRRDFTVNGLFLDPVRHEIVDWVGGMEDVERRRLHAIGDPDVRFREDPVRVLRLIKFMRRLRLEPAPEDVAAARAHAQELEHAAPARVAEETFRLMATGAMEGVWLDLEALGVLDLVIPEVAAWVGGDAGRRERLLARLRALDALVQDGGEPDYGLRLAVLFGLQVEQEMDPRTRTLATREFAQVPSMVLRPFQQRARIPRTSLSRATRILLAQQRMDPPPYLRKRKGRRWEPARLIESDAFPDALEYLRCRLEADDRPLDLYDEWGERALSLREEGR